MLSASAFAMLARARSRTLSTDTTVVSSTSAVSAAEKVEHVAQHQHCALARRDVPQRRHERQSQARWIGLGNTRGRDRLQPRHLSQLERAAWVRLGHESR
ncbi:hypothetical protein ABFU82_04945 [Nocardioides sp. WV_118_6]